VSNSGAGSSPRDPGVDAALKDLRTCVDRIQALIPRVHAVIDRRVGATARLPPRPRIIYGGGMSAFAHGESSAGQDDRMPATLTLPEAPAEHRGPGLSRQLLVAADLALGGYSREQIGVRLRAWDERDAVLAIDEAFE
jgi:hypothetical protein